MSRAVEGFKSEALRAALRGAAASPAANGSAYESLAQLLSKFGGLPGVRPNLNLATAFGLEVAQLTEKHVGKLLDQLAEDVAAPDTPRAFLPVAAAHGYAQRVLHDIDAEASWRGLQLLAADERLPIRMGTINALQVVVAQPGQLEAFVVRLRDWLDDPEREISYGAIATALELLSEARLVATLRDQTALHELLSRVMDSASNAPRSASRSDGRKRVLRTLPNMLANLVASSRAAEGSSDWFRSECERTRDPELRAVLSQALQRLADLKNAPGRGLIDELRASLEGSAKPLRDAARVRPGAGRGRRSRPLR